MVCLQRKDPLRNAMNEVLREEYADDCQRVVKAWNRALKKEKSDFQIKLPHTRFFRRQGIYSDHHFDLEGNMISAEESRQTSTNGYHHLRIVSMSSL